MNAPVSKNSITGAGSHGAACTRRELHTGIEPVTEAPSPDRPAPCWLAGSNPGLAGRLELKMSNKINNAAAAARAIAALLKDGDRRTAIAILQNQFGEDAATSYGARRRYTRYV
jgi:hypothetical protein